MVLRRLIITALAAAALAMPACRYQNMQARNAEDLSTPYYDLECHLEAGIDLDMQQDVAFSFSPYGCSCNPRMSYAVGAGDSPGLERRFELDFELSSTGSSHVRAISDSVDAPGTVFIYNASDPASTIQEIPMSGESTAEEQDIRERIITMWQGLWPLFYNTEISGGGPIMDRMIQVCVEDDITAQADVVREEGYIFMMDTP